MLENTKQLKLLPLTTASKLARETEAAARSSSVLTRREKGGGAYTAVRGFSRVHCRAGLGASTRGGVGFRFQYMVRVGGGRG